jgi:hypothetical protein
MLFPPQVMKSLQKRGLIGFMAAGPIVPILFVVFLSVCGWFWSIDGPAPPRPQSRTTRLGVQNYLAAR